MGNEWDTGLHKEILILATEAVNKWGEKLYQQLIFKNCITQLTVRVKEQKVDLIWVEDTYHIDVEVHLNNTIYVGMFFERSFGEWKYNEYWSNIEIKMVDNHVIHLL